MRDITLGETIDFKFTTCEPDTGAPATLSGTPVISAYVGNSTTQITAGITLTVDFDGVTGLNNVRVVASAGNGFADATDVALIITTGTVDAVSAVGYKVAEFTIGRSAAHTRLGAPAGASVSADIAAIEAQTDDIGVAGAGLTAIPWNAAWDAEVQSEVADALAVYDPPTNAEMEARTLVAASYATAAAVGAIETDTQDIQARLPAALVGGRMDSNMQAAAAGVITASVVATGAIDADALAADAVTEIADGILDRNMATGTDSGSPTVRTPRQALRALRNRVAVAAGTATVYAEDDSTASWTAAVTTAAGNPISEVDPASA